MFVYVCVRGCLCVCVCYCVVLFVCVLKYVLKYFKFVKIMIVVQMYIENLWFLA